MNEIEELKLYLKTLPRLSDKGRDKRVKRALKDFRFFVNTYVPHHIEFQKEETSCFRNFVYDELPELCNQYRHILLEAYRGSAKTTLITRLKTLWKMIKDKRFGVIISSNLDISISSLELIKAELEDNISLISDFDIKISDTTWTKDAIVFEANGLLRKIQTFGYGKRIRGLNFLSFRPDWIVPDDLENDENVESLAQRDKAYKWFTKAVMKLPARKNKNYNIVYPATRLHHDSLTARLSKRDDFLSFNFPLVRKFPINLDLITKENYKTIKYENMIIDDSELDPIDIIGNYLEDKDSFYSEFQNQPMSKDGLTFSSFKTFSVMPKCHSYVIAVDPALGKEKGCYFGISLIGYEANTKKFFWQAWGYKIHPSLTRDIIIKLFIKTLSTGSPVQLAMETVQFQEYYKDDLKNKAKELGIHIPVIELKNNGVPKELRIDALAPNVIDETILVHEDSHLLIEELSTYPKAAHVDLLDSGEMAWRVLSRGTGLDYTAVKKAMKNFKKFTKGDNFA